MRDKARQYTDRHLSEMEDHIRVVYRQAHDEITEKWDAYMLRGQERLNDLYSAFMAAPPAEKQAAMMRYQDAVRAYTLQNRWYKDMVDETTYRLAHTNELAIAYVNGEIPAIYAANYNFVDADAFLIRSSWTLRSEEVIRNLMLDSLPQKSLNYAKDMLWNSRQINNAVLQGILQGESIPKIAKRIVPIVDNNEKAAIRTARTLVTSAENQGRQDRYEEYADDGIITHKVWIATPDHRVRDWHLSMDGQEVDIHEAFIDGHGEALEYPGDPSGSPQTVYNCRCTMRNQFVGVRNSDGSITSMTRYRDGMSLHDRQIAAERARRYKEEYEEEYDAW